MFINVYFAKYLKYKHFQISSHFEILLLTNLNRIELENNKIKVLTPELQILNPTYGLQRIRI